MPDELMVVLTLFSLVVLLAGSLRFSVSPWRNYKLPRHDRRKLSTCQHKLYLTLCRDGRAWMSTWYDSHDPKDFCAGWHMYAIAESIAACVKTACTREELAPILTLLDDFGCWLDENSTWNARLEPWPYFVALRQYEQTDEFLLVLEDFRDKFWERAGAELSES